MPGVFRKRWQPYRRRRRRRLAPGGAASSLAAGAASFVSSGPGGIAVAAAAPTGGAPGYTYQWQRSVTSGGGFTNLAGATAASWTDSTASAGTLYYYRCVEADSAAASATTNEVSAQVYSGGALSGGGVSRARAVNA